MAVPRIRLPRCLTHHTWHASCQACGEQRQAERLAALARLERARVEAGGL